MPTIEQLTALFGARVAGLLFAHLQSAHSGHYSETPPKFVLLTISLDPCDGGKLACHCNLCGKELA